MDLEAIEIDDVTCYIDTETVCNICSAEFLDPNDLLIHTREVHSNGKGVKEQSNFVKCQFCPEMASDLEQYVLHLRDIHLTSMGLCEYCSRVFADTTLLRKHKNKHVINIDRSLYSCSQCKMKFNSITDLEGHEAGHTDCNDGGAYLQNCYPLLSSVINIKADVFLHSYDKPMEYLCVQCKFATINLLQYVQHLKIENCRSYACDKCSNVYQRKIGLHRHITTRKLCQGGDAKRRCEKCGVFFDTDVYKKHVKSCEAIKCIACDIIFQSLQELSEHQSKKHPLSVNLKYCRYCKKEFVGTLALDKHLNRIHKADRHLYKYKCVYCDQVYKHPKHLFTHFFKKHLDLEPYTCKMCSKTFRMRKRFTLHIKLEHESKGFVEFDENFHVFFTDKKSKNPFQPSAPDYYQLQNAELSNQADKSDDNHTGVQSDTDVSGKKTVNQSPAEKGKRRAECVNVNSDFISATENEGNNDGGNTKDSEKKEKSTVGRKRKKTKVQSDIVSDLSEDEPLIVVRKRMKMRRNAKVRFTSFNKNKNVPIRHNRKKFTCNICKKYCYTYQNYNHHMSLHFKNEVKQCIKCSKFFKTKEALNSHMTAKHSSSSLTETLKTILENRKVAKEVTISEKFVKTIKKVQIERSTTAATVTPVSKDISVKKFIENFTPESSEVKKSLVINANLTIKPATGPPKEPMIKMKRFTPEVEKFTGKLAMPIRFQRQIDEEEHHVSVRLVKGLGKNKISFNPRHEHDSDIDGVVNIDDDFADNTEHIPEVAQEVMLEVERIEDPSPKPLIPRTQNIVLPKITDEYKNVRIAHLLPQAPYYKIVKLDDILSGQKIIEKTPPPPAPPKPTPEVAIKLPNGTKLVNVNPLAHLLGDKTIDDIPINVNKHYQRKTQDYEKALAKALLRLNKPRVSKLQLKSSLTKQNKRTV